MWPRWFRWTTIRASRAPPGGNGRRTSRPRPSLGRGNTHAEIAGLPSCRCPREGAERLRPQTAAVEVARDEAADILLVLANDPVAQGENVHRESTMQPNY